MRRLAMLAVTMAAVGFACVSGQDAPPCDACTLDSGIDAGVDAGSDAGTDAGLDAGTDAGADAGPITLTVGEWNLEFFGKADAGPSNDALQVSNVTTVMGQINADVWALEEVCDEPSFSQVIANLKSQYGEDYGYVLANDPNIGNAYQNYGGAWGQKTAVVYRKSVGSVLGAQLVYDYAWGGDFVSRDPLEVHLRLTVGSGQQDVYFVVVHLKSGADQASYDTRAKESVDLKGYLDANRSNVPLWVVGDWNDDVNQSMTVGDAGTPEPSPFANLLSDSAAYQFPTQGFAGAGQSTTTHFPTPIDHHLISNELFGNLEAGSAQVIHPSISSYATTTSDHYPTVVRYHFP